MDPLADNPFAALTFIAAPALLTNSCAVLLLSTSNRFARAIDRARALSRQLDEGAGERTQDASQSGETMRQRQLRQLTIAERRVLLLVRALTAFYVAAGGFAAGTLIALLGGTLVTLRDPSLLPMALDATLVVGIAGFCALVFGAVTLTWETRMAAAMLREEAKFVRRLR